MEEMSKKKEFLSGLMEIRHVLETWAAATAAIRILPGEVEELKAIVREMRNNQTKKIGYELNVKVPQQDRLCHTKSLSYPYDGVNFKLPCHCDKPGLC